MRVVYIDNGATNLLSIKVVDGKFGELKTIQMNLVRTVFAQSREQVKIQLEKISFQILVITFAKV